MSERAGGWATSIPRPTTSHKQYATDAHFCGLACLLSYPSVNTCPLAIVWSVGLVCSWSFVRLVGSLQTNPLRIHLHKMYQINIKWLLVIAAELFRGNVITNLIMPVSRVVVVIRTPDWMSSPPRTSPLMMMIWCRLWCSQSNNECTCPETRLLGGRQAVHC